MPGQAPFPTNPYPPISPTVPTWQYVGGTGAINGNFGIGSSQVTEYWDVPDTDVVQFVQEFLGWSVKSGTRIARNNPARHPYYPYLRASRITGLEGIGPNGIRSATYGMTASWKLIRLSVQFETPPYQILEDNQVTISEFQRNIVPEDFDAETEFIQRGGGQFQFPSGTPGLSNLTIQGSVAQRVGKEKKTYLWVNVPDDGLFDSGGFDNGGFATNMEAAVGTVNDAYFFDYPPGTLLMLGWKPISRTMPVDPSVLSPGNPNIVPRAWDVKIVFSYFDPPPGDVTKLGHNLVPHPTNGLWYRAFQFGKADTSQYWRYPTSNFYNIFEMV